MYLWKTYGPAMDMTGGYVDSEKYERLLKNPTKAAARDECMSQINYWFEVGTEPEPVSFIQALGPVTRHDDPRVVEIARRYWISDFDFSNEDEMEPRAPAGAPTA